MLFYDRSAEVPIETPDLVGLTPQQQGARTRAARNGGRHPGGRPTKYDAEMSDRAIALGRQGKSRTCISAELAVSPSTLAAWAERHGEFRWALEFAKTCEQAWREELGRLAMFKPAREFNTSLWAHQMRMRFTDDWGRA